MSSAGVPSVYETIHRSALKRIGALNPVVRAVFWSAFALKRAGNYIYTQVYIHIRINVHFDITLTHISTLNPVVRVVFWSAFALKRASNYIYTHAHKHTHTLVYTCAPAFYCLILILILD